MKRVRAVVERSQKLFRERMEWLAQQGGMSEDFYVRLLSMEYHLTNGVQRHFIIAASHPDLARRKGLRQFLLDFANVEEQHYLIALNDMKQMNRDPYPCSMDIRFWKAHFDSVILERPFLRLGGTCILENITGLSKDVVKKLLGEAKFLNDGNMKFITIHQHEELPHGDEIFDALEKANLEEKHIQDLIEGAQQSTVLFIRMIDWCLFGEELKTIPASRP